MNNILDVLQEAQRVVDENGTLGAGKIPTAQTLLARNVSSDASDVEKPKNWKKPKDMPRRPLSAYNLFFKSERERIVSSIVKEQKPQKGRGTKTLGIGFAGLARNIATKWKTLDSSEREIFDAKAKIEKLRYRKEMVVWRSKEAAKNGAKKMEQEEKIVPDVTPISPVSTDDYDAPLSSTFDASDFTCNSLQQIMHDTILRGAHENYTSSFPFTNPMPLMTFSSSNISPRSSMLPFNSFAFNRRFERRASIVDPILEDIEPFSQDNSTQDPCWRALAFGLGDDSHQAQDTFQTIQGSMDELNQFMNQMENGTY